MTLYEDLKWRGLIQDISSPDLIDKLNAGGMTFYIGTDPTADSLHLGHYSSFLITRRLANGCFSAEVCAGCKNSRAAEITPAGCGKDRCNCTGFNADIKSKKEMDISAVLSHAEPHDFIKYGIIPELVGRLPVMVNIDPLDKDALVRILTEPKNAVTKQYQKLLSMDGVELEFDREALEAIAQSAIDRNVGARGLRSAIESIMLDVMFDIPSDLSIRAVRITRECVTDGALPEILRADAPRQLPGKAEAPALN